MPSQQYFSFAMCFIVFIVQRHQYSALHSVRNIRFNLFFGIVADQQPILGRYDILRIPGVPLKKFNHDRVFFSIYSTDKLNNACRLSFGNYDYS